jgi:hypothetical protein
VTLLTFGQDKVRIIEKRRLAQMLGLEMYYDLAANVRYTKSHRPIRELVQPGDPEVQAIAQALHESSNFLRAAHQFVYQFAPYAREQGDYWRTPAETLSSASRYWDLVELAASGARSNKMGTGVADCDDKAILLCSILRNYLAADKVFCAIGFTNSTGRTEGHMWVVTEGASGDDIILDATLSPENRYMPDYETMALFNDQFTFATPAALKEFDFKPIKEQAYA